MEVAVAEGGLNGPIFCGDIHRIEIENVLFQLRSPGKIKESKIARLSTCKQRIEDGIVVCAVNAAPANIGIKRGDEGARGRRKFFSNTPLNEGVTAEEIALADIFAG